MYTYISIFGFQPWVVHSGQEGGALAYLDSIGFGALAVGNFSSCHCVFLLGISSKWMFPKIVGFPPKSSISIGFPIINHPFLGIPSFGNTQIIHAPLFFCN